MIAEGAKRAGLYYLCFPLVWSILSSRVEGAGGAGTSLTTGTIFVLAASLISVTLLCSLISRSSIMAEYEYLYVGSRAGDKAAF